MVQAAPDPVRIVRQRRETPARWRNALGRAIANGLEVFTVADTGERMVTSASKLDTLHRSDGRSCTCDAAQAGDPVCQHRAAVRFCLGWLRVEVEPAPAPKTPRCRWCFGNGERYLAGELAECSQCWGQRDAAAASGAQHRGRGRRRRDQPTRPGRLVDPRGVTDW